MITYHVPETQFFNWFFLGAAVAFIVFFIVGILYKDSLGVRAQLPLAVLGAFSAMVTVSCVLVACFAPLIRHDNALNAAATQVREVAQDRYGHRLTQAQARDMLLNQSAVDVNSHTLLLLTSTRVTSEYYDYRLVQRD